MTMTAVSPRQAEAAYKLLFSGPVGAGKTTAIAALSDQAPVSTDMAATDNTKSRKANTTVAMDYGMMRLSVTDQLHLYGTPGQDRFDFMWEILQEGALGLVLLIDNAGDRPLEDLKFFVDSYRDFIDSTALVVGVTRTDLAPTPALQRYLESLDRLGVEAPVFTVDARQRADVARLVEALLFTLDPGLAVGDPASTGRTL